MRYSILLFTFTITAMVLYTGCSKDEDPIQLIANAGDSQTVKPQETVTLNGTASTGPEGFTYSWSYDGDVPESEINFQNKTSAQPTFTPPTGEIYYFTLTTTSGDQVSSDEVTVVASGGLEIGGSLTEDLILVDIEPDAEVPDYIVTSDLIVPSGITLSVGDENVLVHFNEGVGLEVQEGGNLTNVPEGSYEGRNVIFSGGELEGWKGIWINNATIQLNDATIEYGGKGTFEGMDESGSFIMSGSETHFISILQNKINHSFSYSVLVKNQISGDSLFASNSLSYKHPIKAHVTFVEHFNSNYPNIFPDDYDYNIMVPSGANIKDEVKGYRFRFDYGKYLIDGDFWAANDVSASDATVFIKEGCGIVTEGSINFRGPSGGTMMVNGLNDAPWKGIAITGEQNTLFVTNAIVKNGGFGILSAGDFVAEAEATFYGTAWSGKFEDSEIMDGGGYGYYNADTSSNYVAVSLRQTSFSNFPKAAIRTNVPSVTRLFYTFDAGATFDLAPGIPAILVQGNGRADLKWPGLNSDNFYVIDAEITVDPIGGFTLQEGCHLKFKSGRSFIYNPNPGSNYASVNFSGTAENPVVLEGELDEPGSWGGVFLGGGDGWFQIKHTIFKNGGEFILPGATEKANITSAYTGYWQDLVKFHDNNISGSAGYGIVVEAGTYDFEYDAPGKNNEFNDNALGDILVK